MRICMDCPHKCSEYNDSITSDRAYYEWHIKKEKCEKEAKEMKDYLDYATNQPMRDGEEIRDFLNNDEEGEKESAD